MLAAARATCQLPAPASAALYHFTDTVDCLSARGTPHRFIVQCARRLLYRATMYTCGMLAAVCGGAGPLQPLLLYRAFSVVLDLSVDWSSGRFALASRLTSRGAT